MSIYTRTYEGLTICSLTQEQHERTCGYWYTVQSRATAHTAFRTKAQALRWLAQLGLTIANELPEAGTHSFQPIAGSYRRSSHMDVAAFAELQGETVPCLDNAQYTKGIITLDADDLRTLHHLNCNVEREIYDYRLTREAEERDFVTKINSNGGGNAQPIEALFDRLLTHTLDRTFEAYGNFVTRGEEIEAKHGKGAVSFFGNFFDYSHVFHIITDDIDLIAHLTAAIEINKTKTSYIEQCPPFDRSLFSIETHRFSTTQGEVSLFYDGEKLGRFGDDYKIGGNGQFSGRSLSYWEDAAKRILQERHVEAVRKQRAA